jgi:hypothetical protein
MRVELHLVQFGDALHEVGHLGAELDTELIPGDPCVFDRVVQDGGGDALVIHPHAGEDLRHGDRVQNVRLAGFPRLAAVGRFACLVGLEDEGDFIGIQVSAEQVPELQDGFGYPVAAGIGVFGACRWRRPRSGVEVFLERV